MTRLIGLLVLFVAVVGIAPGSQAAPVVFTTQLEPEGDAIGVSDGSGFSRLTIDLVALTMRVEAQFQDLTTGTTVAHIHSPTEVPFAGTVGVATQLPSFDEFPVGVTSGTYDRTFDLGDEATFNPAFIANFGGGTAIGAAEALFQQIREGRAYLNIHTTQFPGGEIRGFYVPEPGSIALLGMGTLVLGGVGLARRRKARPRP